MIQDLPFWQTDLISQTVLSEQMNSPLVFAASYAETLLDRIEKGDVHTFELNDLARITRDSVIRAMGLWRKLDHLYYSSVGQTPDWQLEAVNLHEAFQRAEIEVTEWAVQGRPKYVFSLPDELPAISAEPTQLHNALCALLDTVSINLTPNDRVLVTASQRQNSIQISLAPEGNQNTLRSDLFDIVPGAIAEQVVSRLNGRIWLEMDNKKVANAFVFVLPIWVPTSSKDIIKSTLSAKQHRQALMDLAEVLSKKQPDD